MKKLLLTVLIAVFAISVNAAATNASVKIESKKIAQIEIPKATTAPSNIATNTATSNRDSKVCANVKNEPEATGWGRNTAANTEMKKVFNTTLSKATTAGASKTKTVNTLKQTTGTALNDLVAANTTSIEIEKDWTNTKNASCPFTCATANTQPKVNSNGTQIKKHFTITANKESAANVSA